MNKHILHGVDATQVDHVWDKCSEYLIPALARNNDYDIDDIYVFILNRQMQLWIIRDPTIKAAFVTQIISYPQQRVLSMPYLGGIDSEHWVHLLDEVALYGKSLGCKKVRMFIREGWRKRLNMNELKKEFLCVAKDL